MTRIEDRLTGAAHELRRRVEREIDTEAALAAVAVSPGTRRRPLLAAAAAVALVALGAGGLVVAFGGDESHLVADGGPSTSAPRPSSTTAGPETPSELRVGGELRVLFGGPTDVPVGTLSYAGTASAFDLQWRTTMVGAPGDPPEVDFDDHLVLSVTSCSGRLLGLDLVGDDVVVRFLEPSGGCRGGGPPSETYAVAVDRADLPRRFALLLPASADGARAEVRLEVDQDEDDAVHLGSSGDDPEPDGPDLAQPEPGREITFEGVGEVRLGQVLDPSEVQPHEGGTCGYWGPAEPTHDRDEPPGGLVDGAGSAAPTVLSIQVRNPTYRTASGVGVGTSLATLERVYGGDLVVDHPDPDATPTDGLVAYYQSVAGVRYGDQALAFYLRDDVVEAVKVSSAGFWGDDEGCA